MKGVVLAGGLGQRLSALTGGANKHLLPVAGRPMIDHPIATLIDAGLSDILVVTGAQHADAIRQHLSVTPLANQAKLSLALQKEANGIAGALACAESFAAGEPVCVILGDNILQRTPARAIATFADDPAGAQIFLTRTDEPSRFAIATFEGEDPSRPITGITEKPASPASDAAVIGLYLYDHRVFNIIRSLAPSSRGELEITDVNNAYLNDGQLRHEFIEGWWIDAGTPESLARAQSLLAQQEPRA